MRNYIRKLILSFLAIALLPSAAFAATPAATHSNYRLSPVDKVEINVFRQANMRTSQRIDGRGNVSLPLLGSIHIGGLTVGEAEQKIARSYEQERFLRNPSVGVSIIEYAPKTITVMGQVEEPGEIELPIEVNTVAIPRAIAMAGGFTGTARQSRVKVIRNNGDEGESTYTVDVGRQLRDGTNRFMAQPGDTIVVPRRIF